MRKVALLCMIAVIGKIWFEKKWRRGVERREEARLDY
jgi:hypothetical protein